MREYRDRIFHSLIDRGEAQAISSQAFYGCEFKNCALSLTKEMGKRATITDILLQNCTISASCIGPAVLRRVKIDGLITDSLLIAWGTVFDQVVFTGKIGKIKINTAVHHVDKSDAVQGPFDDFRKKFYSQIEWALDISTAKFRLLEISGIPARLIRRDPATQMIITRQSAANPEWRSRLSPDNKHWPFCIEMFLARGEQDHVFVLPLIGPKKQLLKLRRDIEELRELGVVM